MPPTTGNDPNSPSITSSCHCGSIQLTFPKPTTALTQCECSTCTKNSTLWTYFDESQVKILVRPGTHRQKDGTYVYPATEGHKGRSQVNDGKETETYTEGGRGENGREKATRYGMGAGVMDYLYGDKMIHICRCEGCGCVTHWVSTEKFDSTMMAVNCRMLDKEVLRTLEIKITPDSNP